MPLLRGRFGLAPGISKSPSFVKTTGSAGGLAAAVLCALDIATLRAHAARPLLTGFRSTYAITALRCFSVRTLRPGNRRWWMELAPGPNSGSGQFVRADDHFYGSANRQHESPDAGAFVGSNQEPLTALCSILRLRRRLLAWQQAFLLQVFPHQPVVNRILAPPLPGLRP
jgi:hypothetical protein